MGATPVLAAALSGIPAGIQRQGPWAGRRQLFVRFAGPAETAQMYTADALARELGRSLGRTVFHSVCVTGRDALGNPDFLAAALRQLPPGTEVMVDTDGQRPESLPALHPFLTFVQVTLEPPVAAAALDHAMETVRTAAHARTAHAVTIAGTDEASDADYLQIVEQTHEASAATAIVIHPGPSAERGAMDKRWSTLMEHASARHRDVRLLARLNGPATMR
jgi:organic radical activating enzyme